MSGSHFNRAGRLSGGARPVQLSSGPIDHDFVLFCIYKNPSDFPGKHVVRRFVCKKGVPDPIPDEKPYAVTYSLEAARVMLPMSGLMRCPRSPGDDPVIVESWF